MNSAPAITVNAPVDLSNASPAEVKDMKIADVAATADALLRGASSVSKLSDRSWVALLMAFGMVALIAVFYWHRQDQQAMTELFRETIKTNTEALTRSTMAIERLERLPR